MQLLQLVEVEQLYMYLILVYWYPFKLCQCLTSCRQFQADMLNFNVGVLGHVDSGKTSLVKALSTTPSTACFDKNPQVIPLLFSQYSKGFDQWYLYSL